MGVEAGRRLVEEKDLGLVDESPGDRQAALHAARKRLNQVARPVTQLHEVEQLHRPAARLGVRQVEVATVDEQVLEHRQLCVERVRLGHHAQAAADARPMVVRVGAKHGQLTARARRHGADHAHGRGLAGAVGTQKTERLTRRDVEVDRVYGCERPEALGQAAGMDERLTGSLGFGHGGMVSVSRTMDG